MKRVKESNNYLRQYPEATKWLNQCVICQTTGHKPEIPEKIYPGYLAQNIRKFFKPLPVNELNICEECFAHWEK